ncbi:MAG: hypothetical protein NT178_15220 [Proteobacteria bacterium]|nr:hypothetical protein [Pseudomonadota bacterium]
MIETLDISQKSEVLTVLKQAFATQTPGMDTYKGRTTRSLTEWARG